MSEWEGRCKATWEREFKLPWREAGPPNHHDGRVDSDQQVVNKELSGRAGPDLRESVCVRVCERERERVCVYVCLCVCVRVCV